MITGERDDVTAQQRVEPGPADQRRQQLQPVPPLAAVPAPAAPAPGARQRPSLLLTPHLPQRGVEYRVVDIGMAVHLIHHGDRGPAPGIAGDQQVAA